MWEKARSFLWLVVISWAIWVDQEGWGNWETNHLRWEEGSASPVHPLILSETLSLNHFYKILIKFPHIGTHSFWGQEPTLSLFAWQSKKAILFYFITLPTHPPKKRWVGKKLMIKVLQKGMKQNLWETRTGNVHCGNSPSHWVSLTPPK